MSSNLKLVRLFQDFNYIMIISYNLQSIYKRRVRKRGSGLINTLINKLPCELHLPGYNFCGPGTKLEKRLARGDKGINLLDEACKEHDITYPQSNDIKSRYAVEKLLANKAAEGFRAKAVTFGEKTAALGIRGAIKVKKKFGMGLKKGRKQKSKNPSRTRNNFISSHFKSKTSTKRKTIYKFN